VTPIRSIDRVTVGEATPGPVTRRLMDEFLDITRGRREDRFGWLTPVPATVAAPVG
jgi:branched-chain amino acid aminotransferase